MVSAAMGIHTDGIEVSVEGDLDLQGTLGMSKTAPVGFESIRVNFNVNAPQATLEQLSALQQKTEQYCVVMQTLLHPPPINHVWERTLATSSSTGTP
jgi:uncharacterized OsmC-like protein